MVIKQCRSIEFVFDAVPISNAQIEMTIYFAVTRAKLFSYIFSAERSVRAGDVCKTLHCFTYDDFLVWPYNKHQTL